MMSQQIMEGQYQNEARKTDENDIWWHRIL